MDRKSEMKRILIAAAGALLGACGCAVWTGPSSSSWDEAVPVPRGGEKAFAEALRLEREGSYGEAAESFKLAARRGYDEEICAGRLYGYDAILDLTAAIKRNPAPGGGGGGLHIKLGLAFYNKEWHRKALEQYEEARRTGGDSSALLYLTAMAHVGAGDPAAAEAELLKAIDLDRNWGSMDTALAQVAMGRLHLMRGEVERAIARFRAVLEADPKCAPAHAGLGRALYFKGDYAEALKELGEADGLSTSGWTDYTVWSVYRTLGDSRAADSAIAGAIAAFRKALDENPFDVGSMRGLARMTSEAPEALQEAQRLAVKALSISPSGESYGTLGYVYMRAGRLEEAAEFLGGAIKRQGAESDYHYWLAMALGELGKTQAALEALEAAVRINPLNPLRIEAQRRIPPGAPAAGTRDAAGQP